MRSKIMEGVRYYKFRSHDDGFGVKGWRFDPVGKSTPKEHTHHLNTFLGALSGKPRFSW